MSKLWLLCLGLAMNAGVGLWRDFCDVFVSFRLGTSVWGDSFTIGRSHKINFVKLWLPICWTSLMKTQLDHGSIYANVPYCQFNGDENGEDMDEV